MTDALDYAVNALAIGALMTFLLAYEPSAAKPMELGMVKARALTLALWGSTNSAFALAAAAAFIAAAKSATGLDRRIALVALSKVDARTDHIVIGEFGAGLGVISRKESQLGFPWGAVVLFAVGISVGTALLRTRAAGWLADLIDGGLGLEQASAFAMLMLLLLSAFLIQVHLGFSSATAPGYMTHAL